MPSAQRGLSTTVHGTRPRRARTSRAPAPSTTCSGPQPASASAASARLRQRASALLQERLGPAAEAPAAAGRQQQPGDGEFRVCRVRIRRHGHASLHRTSGSRVCGVRAFVTRP
ncbi:hypothetical protein GCM10020221_27080 [Streptomyces thioluteus]|uniref:Uncharacterized protein n=1 Tax=Streptomyces thioluteus TaxID=66431 RepID=A0ABN3WYA4_STRTU